MALHQYFSNDVETLGQEFLEKLDAAWGDPLRPPALLVPNRYVEKWLKLFVSRKQGALVGLRGEFIEKFLWRMLVEGADAGKNATLIDGPLLCQVLLHVMERVEKDGGPPGLFALRNYLLAEGHASGRVKRRIGLATRLSGLFLEYEYSRPDLYDARNVRRFEGILSAWPDRDYFAEKNAEALSMETWQRQLYKTAMEVIRARFGPGYVTLPGALAGAEFSLAGIERRVERALAGGPRDPVFIFGMSGMSLFHRQVMLGLSRSLHVHVFTLNPCSAFWEDVNTTGREMAGRVGKATSRRGIAGLTFDEPRWKSFSEENWDDKSMGEIRERSGSLGENRLLSLWGHAGKENIALWCQAAEYRFNERYTDAPSGSVLAEVHRSILYRRNEAPFRRAPDESLIVFDAPGIRREVETMRDYVLEAMRGDESLLPSDIGVFVADADGGAYDAALHEALDEYPVGHPLHVPWLMADEKGKTSLFCKAVTGILDLTDGSFSRNAVFSLLHNPLVAAAFGGGEAIDTWESWAAQCGVCHGLDKRHRLSLGEHDPSAQHTWRMAFDRLLSAGISDTDLVFAAAGAPEDPEETVRPFADLESRDTGLCGRFVRTVEALYRDVSSLAKQNSWSQASEKLIAVVKAWTTFPREFSDEERVADQYLEDLSLFSVRDGLSSPSAGEMTFDFEEFKALALERADVAVPVRTAYLTGRLTVSCIRPSRAIPFKIVYVLGMNEGSFPGSADKDTLDLRTWKHVPGDLRPFRQAQYAFLELLVCAQQRLVLSFVGHDLTRDEPLLPCSTLFELQSFVNDAVLEPGRRLEFSKIPLLAEGEDGSAPGKWQPPTYGGEAAIMSGPRAAPRRTRARVNASAAGRPASEVVHYSTTQLAAFLRNPLEYTLRKSLNLYDDTDTVASDDTEPFAAAAMDRWRIKQTFVRYVCDHLFGTRRGPVANVLPDSELSPQWDACLRQAYRDAIVEGRGAERVFAEFDMLGLASETRALADALSLVAREKHGEGWIFDPGKTLQTEKEGMARPYLELALENRRLRISSPAHRIFIDPKDETRCEVLEVCVSGKTVEDDHVVRRKNLLEPILFSCANAAGDLPAHWSVLFVGHTGKNGGAAPVLRTVDIDAATARAYLTGLARAIENPDRRFDHVPFEIVEDLWASGEAITRRSIEDRLAENDENGFRQVYRCNLEACAIAEKSVPDDGALEALVRERFTMVLGSQAGGDTPEPESGHDL
jgi:exonuclease V gamma subunit